MNKIFLSISLLLFILIHHSFAQDCYECESNNYKTDTNNVFLQIQNRYKYLSSLNRDDFDYIYVKEYDSECNEPDIITETVKYLDNKVAIRSKSIIGSGEGGYYSNSKVTQYFNNDNLIFMFEVKSGGSMNGDNGYIEEIRTYYDGCGQIFRKLIKKVSDEENHHEKDLNKLIKKTGNKDITPKHK